MSSSKRPLLYLINPRFKYKHYATQQELSELIGKKTMTIPVQLPLLAALTPDHWDIKIIDDEIAPLITHPRPDLVGITTLSATIERVYEIADIYRGMGVPVVMGGSYTTFQPDAVLEHADHIVLGEAEGAWPRFLADFERGEAQERYQNDSPPEFKTSPIPRWDLTDIDNMMTVSIETSRGCPFRCDFCVVHKMFGRKMRYRDIDDVVRELAAAPIKRVFFVADNFAINMKYARELVSRLEPLGLSWICQTSIQSTEDVGFLREMADAGCVSMLVGFESLNEAALHGVGKHQNQIEEFERAIERIHSVGIHVLASFIVGFDEDTAETFDVIYDFIIRNNLVYAMINAMSVAPGTNIFAKMEEAGRIAVVEPAYRNGIFPCIHYNRLSQRQMLDKFWGTLGKMFSWESLYERAIPLFESGNFCRDTPQEVPVLEKVDASLVLVRRFLLSRNRTKRKLFLRLAALVRKKRLAPDKMVLFLLNMEAFNEYYERMCQHLPEVRRRLAAIDKGPWAEQSGGGEMLLTQTPTCATATDA